MSSQYRVLQIAAFLLVVRPVADAFYLPGVAPRQFMDGDKVDIRVHKLSSPRTHLPYDYYSLPFCRPEEVVKQAENLGEVLHGAVIQNSPYEVLIPASVLPQGPTSHCRATRRLPCTGLHG